MSAFQLHLLQCSVCSAMPRIPCVEGWRLLNDLAQIEARRYDPKRAKA